MKRLLMSTAIVGLAALPGFAIAQSDQADDTMTQEQSETDTGAGAQAEAGKETGAKAGTGSDMEDGAQSGTETGSGTDTDAKSQTGSDDSKAGSSMDSSTASDAAGSSDKSSGSNDTKSSGSNDMMSDDKAEVSEGHSEVDPSTVEASEVNGAPVMSRDEEELADVSEVLLTEDGSIESIIVNVGGVLGIGSKPVEIPFDQVTLQTNDEDGEMSVIIPMSKKELEDMPRYEES